MSTREVASINSELGGQVAFLADAGSGLVTGIKTAFGTTALGPGATLAASAYTDTTDAANIGSGTLPAGRLPALTGDVTSPAGSAATTISPAAPALTQQSTNAQTGTTYTFALTDAGQNVDLSNAAAITATIPPHSSVAYPNGTMLYWTQVGVGAATIAPGTGVTLTKPTARSLTTSAQLEGGYAYQVSQDNWRVYNG